MECVGTSQCSDGSVGLPATMIRHEDGAFLLASLQAGESVSIEFNTVASLGTDFLIDAQGAIRQSWGGSGLGSAAVDGNPGDPSAKLYPRMSFLAWAARFELYRKSLTAQLEQQGVAVPIFNLSAVRLADGDCYGDSPWGCGPSALVSVPAVAKEASVHLDLALSCNGSSDVDCPQWDHVVQLRACIATVATSLRCDAQAGPEVGRWITSFGRGAGRWLSDISPISALISNTELTSKVNFTIFSAPWAGNQGSIPWLATLSLRLGAARASRSEAAATPAAVLAPWPRPTTEPNGIAEVFGWVTFNQSYAHSFPNFSFVPPAAARRVRLYVLISGHGNDNHGCGEFCATEHRFSINGAAPSTIRDLLPLENEAVGCAEAVDTGVTPNEYGTWLYGRDGWCNGRPVLAHVFDVSKEVFSAAQVASTLSYSALWCSAPGVCVSPDPGPPDTWQQAEPVMMVSAYIITD